MASNIQNLLPHCLQITAFVISNAISAVHLFVSRSFGSNANMLRSSINNIFKSDGLLHSALKFPLNRLNTDVHLLLSTILVYNNSVPTSQRTQ